MRRRIACEHCDGTGMRELTEIEHNTRTAAGARWSETGVIRARLRVIQGYDTTPTALINRLNDLAVRGLVERKAINGRRLAWRQSSGLDVRGQAIEIERWGRQMRGQR